jgi:FKBP-type peptidyl-prolyl cis-trans isomerase FklB
MKHMIAAVVCLGLAACQGTTQEKVDLKTKMDSVSYSIGLDIGKNLKAQSIEVNPSALAEGMRVALGTGKGVLTDEQVQAVMTQFQQEMMEQQAVKAHELGEKNKKEGEAFLAANKTKEGVVTTASGLQYKILKAGTGKKPTDKQTVTVHYRGTLIDGTEIDNSYKRGQPATRAVTGFIKGWTEALQLMPVGSKWQLFMPGELAYGDRGMGSQVPPNAALIFEVELISVQ